MNEERKTIPIEEISDDRKTILIDENDSRNTVPIEETTNRNTILIDEEDDRKTISIEDDRNTIPLEEKDERSTIAIDDDSLIPNQNSSKKGKKVVNVDSLIGKSIDGYEISKMISCSSGQSVIYLANKDNQRFILKLYRNDSTIIDPLVVKFLSTQTSPYVIPILHSGTVGGRFFTITPYYEEGSVSDHLEELDQLTIKETYIRQLNEGLKAIHDADIVHLDIKPANIYFADNRTRLVIGDFGIAIPFEKFSGKVIGETLPKRALRRNNASLVFSAPEALEFASKYGDYYSLGITLLYMAYRGDIYQGISDTEVRNIVMSEGLRIPDVVDPEIAMLIKRLTFVDKFSRFDYEKIKRWCDDPSYYGKYFNKKTSPALIEIDEVNFDGEILHNTGEYIDALLEYYKEGYQSYLTGELLNNFAKALDTDQDLLRSLNRMRKKYLERDMGEQGFLYTLLCIDPRTPFAFGRYKFSTIKEYVRYLRNNFLTQTVFFDERCILKFIQNQGTLKRILNADEVYKRVKDLFLNDVPTPFKVEMFCNYLSDDETMLINEKLVNQLYELSYLMFDENLNALQNHEIFNPIFMNYLVNNYKNIKEDKEKINKLKEIVGIKDIFLRNARFSIFLTGTIQYEYQGRKLNTVKDFLMYTKDVYENRLDPSHLAKLIREGKLLKVAEVDGGCSEKEIEFIKETTADSSKYESDAALITKFYQFTQEKTIFFFKGKAVNNIKELIDILTASNDLEAVTNELLNSFQFRLWLEGNGFDDALEILKGNEK